MGKISSILIKSYQSDGNKMVRSTRLLRYDSMVKFVSTPNNEFSIELE